MNEETPMYDESEPTTQVIDPTPAVPSPDRPWHPVHIAHLVMGLAFLGLVTVWVVVVPLNAVELDHARWLLPLPWLVAGAAGLVATVLSGRRRP